MYVQCNELYGIVHVIFARNIWTTPKKKKNRNNKSENQSHSGGLPLFSQNQQQMCPRERKKKSRNSTSTLMPFRSVLQCSMLQFYIFIRAVNTEAIFSKNMFGKQVWKHIVNIYMAEIRLSLLPELNELFFLRRRNPLRKLTVNNFSAVWVCVCVQQLPQLHIDEVKQSTQFVRKMFKGCAPMTNYTFDPIFCIAWHFHIATAQRLRRNTVPANERSCTLGRNVSISVVWWM